MSEKEKQQDDQSQEGKDNRPLFLKDAVYQGELHNAPYALSVSSPKIEPIDKRMLKANAHEAMQHLAEDPALRCQLGTAAAGLMEAHSWDALDSTWRDALMLKR